MNKKDIELAMLFVDEHTRDVVLTFKTHEDLPYMRRALAHTLGEPDHRHPDYLRYGNLRVWMKPLDFEDWHRYAGLPVREYYVRRDDERMTNDYLVLDGFVLANLSLVDIYNCLVREGLHADHALAKMHKEGLINEYQED